MVAAFEDLLLEIDRLRSVGQRIEALADRHPGMENGLVSVAGNILNIASVLDVSRSSEAKLVARRKTPGPTNEWLCELSSAIAPFNAALDVEYPNRGGA